MICVCKDWEENIDKVNAPIVLQKIRGGFTSWDGKAFVYCPWCSSKLQEMTEKQADDVLSKVFEEKYVPELYIVNSEELPEFDNE